MANNANVCMPSPVLPPGLEKAIFEIVAQVRPLSIPVLMRVAWRVKIWLEPLLYRTLLVSTDSNVVLEGHIRAPAETFIPVTHSKPPSFFRNSVRHVLFERNVPQETAESVLTVCSVPYPENTFTITHLELFDTLDDEADDFAGLALIPHLSHLSFNTGFNPVFSVLLDTCKSLQVLVILEDHPSTTEDFPGVAALAEDLRFISMTCIECIQDWHMGAHTGIDYGWRAEEFIAKRQSGEIDRLQYRIPEDETHIDCMHPRITRLEEMLADEVQAWFNLALIPQLV
ncbi:hypothetical protein C8R43DRAFT_1211138 [Mycena crocata]|nr:hypothetical protein C8R43DRAFT_1211138 [Mycena crocata]